MSSWGPKLQEALEAARPNLVGVTSIALFGSALREAQPRDLDLLVVYEPSIVAPERAGRLRAPITATCASFGLPVVDVVLLTREEADATDFAQREGACAVYHGITPRCARTQSLRPRT